jgi:hypothetical protein
MSDIKLVRNRLNSFTYLDEKKHNFKDKSILKKDNFK